MSHLVQQSSALRSGASPQPLPMLSAHLLGPQIQQGLGLMRSEHHFLKQPSWELEESQVILCHARFTVRPVQSCKRVLPRMDGCTAFLSEIGANFWLVEI